MRLENSAVIGEELALSFSDGRECYLPLAQLREACPCAVCQGEPDAMGRVIRPEKRIGAGGDRLLELRQVGGYALQLVWGDGHSTGIYSYDYLRRLAQSE